MPLPVLSMPQLHLSEVGAYWFAVTRMPHEPHLHNELVEAVRNEAIRNILKKTDPRSVDREILLDLATRAASGPRLFDIATKTKTRPITMGHHVVRPDVAVGLFLYVLSCHQAADPKREPATLENARKVYGTAGGRYKSYPGLGRSELIEIWNTFAPAVHLLTVEKIFSEEWEEQITRNQAPFWALILACSEKLRILGEGHRPARSKTPLLNPAETYKVPDWIALPPLPADWPVLPHPSRLRAEMERWPHPRDIHRRVDMST
jgi:hypothetical protein